MRFRVGLLETFSPCLRTLCKHCLSFWLARQSPLWENKNDTQSFRCGPPPEQEAIMKDGTRSHGMVGKGYLAEIMLFPRRDVAVPHDSAWVMLE